MLDLRLPVGLFFTIIGAILAIDGLVHPVHTDGLSFVLNRDWGLCLLVFGLLMTGFGWNAQKHGVTSGGAEETKTEMDRD